MSIGADFHEIMWKKTIRCETAVQCINSQIVLSYYIKILKTHNIRKVEAYRQSICIASFILNLSTT